LSFNSKKSTEGQDGQNESIVSLNKIAAPESSELDSLKTENQESEEKIHSLQYQKPRKIRRRTSTTTTTTTTAATTSETSSSSTNKRRKIGRVKNGYLLQQYNQPDNMRQYLNYGNMARYQNGMGNGLGANTMGLMGGNSLTMKNGSPMSVLGHGFNIGGYNMGGLNMGGWNMGRK
jgi:hypothetical protein